MTRKLNLYIKRIFDVTISSVGLIISMPFWLIGILGIVITMPGPVFFQQERIGKDGKPFHVLKLRTMKVDKTLETSRDMSRDNERRTPWGDFLRRIKIDELPQLINVLKGDMSLVGPRPTVYEHVVLYDEREKHRLDMRPGMTGLAQINGNASLVWEDRIEYDLRYIKDFTVLLDLHILIGTVKVVLFGEDKFVHKLSNIKLEESKYYW